MLCPELLYCPDTTHSPALISEKKVSFITAIYEFYYYYNLNLLANSNLDFKLWGLTMLSSATLHYSQRLGLVQHCWHLAEEPHLLKGEYLIHRKWRELNIQPECVASAPSHSSDRTCIDVFSNQNVTTYQVMDRSDSLEMRRVLRARRYVWNMIWKMTSRFFNNVCVFTFTSTCTFIPPRL